MTKCNNCGSMVKKKSAFCAKCGAKVEIPQTEKSTPKSIILPLLFVFLALIIGIGTGFAIAQISNKEPTGENGNPECEIQSIDLDVKDSVTQENAQEENQQKTDESTVQTEVPENIEVPEDIEVPLPAQEQSIEGYNYVNIGDEVRRKEGIIYDTNPEIYSFRIYNDNVEWTLEGDSDLINNLNYSAIHFMQSQPHDIRLIDSRYDGCYISGATISKYADDLSSRTLETDISPEACYFEYGNVLKISKEYLLTLDAGIYEFAIFIEGDKSSMWPFLVVIHDVSEEVVNYKPAFMSATGFYSTESKNDVLFYLNGSSAPIKNVILDYIALDEESYDLVCNGYGLVLHPDFLEAYKDKPYLEILVQMENNVKAELKIVFLNQVE